VAGGAIPFAPGQGPAAAVSIAAAAAPAVDAVVVTARPACAHLPGPQPDYACLNAQLAAAARGAQPAPANPASADLLGAGAPDRVGTFSFTGLSQQLGSNFGKSAFPQRPPPPAAYRPPLSAPPVARTR
jgi:hypothetical protein